MGVAKHSADIRPAKNVLIFLVQSVTGRLRMVSAYYFVQGLLGKHLKNILVELLVCIKERTKLRVIPWDLTTVPRTKGVGGSC